MKNLTAIITGLFALIILGSAYTSNETKEGDVYSGVFKTASGELVTDVAADKSIGGMEEGDTVVIITYTCENSDVTLPYIYKGDLQAPCTVQTFDNTPAKIRKMTLVSKTKI